MYKYSYRRVYKNIENTTYIILELGFILDLGFNTCNWGYLAPNSGTWATVIEWGQYPIITTH